MFGVAAGLRGYIFSKMAVWMRLVSIAGGLCMIYPGVLTDIIGIVLVGAICVITKARAKKNTPDAPDAPAAA